MDTFGLGKTKINNISMYVDPENFYNTIVLCEMWEYLYDKKQVGVQRGFAYGNLSYKVDYSEFIITGSGSGSKRILTSEDLCCVTKCSLANNYIDSFGLIYPSSETLAHWIVYAIDKRVKSVLHIHNLPLWKKLKNIWPTTPDNAKAGSLALPRAIRKIRVNDPSWDNGCVVIGGHIGGILLFANSWKKLQTKVKNIADMTEDLILNAEGDW